MIGSVPPPRPPTGTSKIVRWLDQLLQYAKSLEVKSVVNGEVSRGPDGTIIKVPRTFGGESSSVTVQQFRFKQSYGDYWVATDGQTQIAKPYKLQNSRASALIDGFSVTYSYITTGAFAYLKRIASFSNSDATEYQGIVPRYLGIDANHNGDLVWCMKIDGGTSVLSVADITDNPADTNIEWLDMNTDGRTWTRLSVQA